MKTEIYFIEDEKLPEIVAEYYLEYPNKKVLDSNGHYVFGYSIIVYNNVKYIVHELDADLSIFIQDLTNEIMYSI